MWSSLKKWGLDFDWTYSFRNQWCSNSYISWKLYLKLNLWFNPTFRNQTYMCIIISFQTCIVCSFFFSWEGSLSFILFKLKLVALGGHMTMYLVLKSYGNRGPYSCSFWFVFMKWKSKCHKTDFLYLRIVFYTIFYILFIHFWFLVLVSGVVCRGRAVQGSWPKKKLWTWVRILAWSVTSVLEQGALS